MIQQSDTHSQGLPYLGEHGSTQVKEGHFHQPAPWAAPKMEKGPAATSLVFFALVSVKPWAYTESPSYRVEDLLSLSLWSSWSLQGRPVWGSGPGGRLLGTPSILSLHEDPWPWVKNPVMHSKDVWASWGHQAMSQPGPHSEWPSQRGMGN